ncbi:MAG: hypothetical protein H6853_08970 [Rhodospirillales bacterium]|nr:hypothetical protein [Alphaproteobacteria bacterium]USO03635.1 MAG: hypothetical protein H6853_08970 [Rhodospirillales bacterium]
MRFTNFTKHFIAATLVSKGAVAGGYYNPPQPVQQPQPVAANAGAISGSSSSSNAGAISGSKSSASLNADLDARASANGTGINGNVTMSPTNINKPSFENDASFSNDASFVNDPNFKQDQTQSQKQKNQQGQTQGIGDVGSKWSYRNTNEVAASSPTAPSIIGGGNAHMCKPTEGWSAAFTIVAGGISGGHNEGKPVGTPVALLGQKFDALTPKTVQGFLDEGKITKEEFAAWSCLENLQSHEERMFKLSAARDVMFKGMEAYCDPKTWGEAKTDEHKEFCNKPAKSGHDLIFGK